MAKKVRTTELLKLIFISVFIGLTCAALGFSLKYITERSEHHLSDLAKHTPILYFVFPFAALSLIFLLRQRLFRKRENKGIKEIFDSLKDKQSELPFYKIPSHYINGFLTVIGGGSTGIEVSMVVASAALGSQAHSKGKIHLAFRKELICSAVAAGVTALFGSPVAGLLFAYEVISKRFTKFAALSMGIAVVTAWGLGCLLHEEPLFATKISHWNIYALPYFILLGVIAGLNSVYLTRMVLFLKKQAAAIQSNALKISIVSILLGTLLFAFPQLYGEGYAAMKDTLTHSVQTTEINYSLWVLLAIFLLKPLVTAATLSGGGDGGVFAPSLFIGAFLGLALALLLNRYFHTEVIPVNFMVIGMAAVLSGSLHAPYTSVFLVCGLVGNYVLIIPILLACIIAQQVAKMTFPYTVYSYSKPAA